MDAAPVADMDAVRAGVDERVQEMDEVPPPPPRRRVSLDAALAQAASHAALRALGVEVIAGTAAFVTADVIAVATIAGPEEADRGCEGRSASSGKGRSALSGGSGGGRAARGVSGDRGPRGGGGAGELPPERRLCAGSIVVATGAETLVPDDIVGAGSVPYWTPETALDMPSLPASLTIVGGGRAGCELAQAFARLGSAVTLVAPSLLPREEPAAGAVVAAALARDGVRLAATRAVTAMVGTDGRVLVACAEGEYASDALLLATGRAPAVGRLRLAAAGVAAGPGGVLVDGARRSSVRTVYAVGPCAAPEGVGAGAAEPSAVATAASRLEQVSAWQGVCAVRAALGVAHGPGGPPAPSGAPPLAARVTHTDPEVASAGRRLAAARAEGGEGVRELRRGLASSDVAAASGAEPAGFVSLVVGPDGRLLGATIVGRGAGEAIGEVLLAMRCNRGVSELGATPHVFPSVGFALAQMCAHASLTAFADSTAGKVLRVLH